MTITVAGSMVQLGDMLYSRRAGTFGTVVQVLDNAVQLRITRGAGQHRDLTVTEGGLVAGTRDVYWNGPLDLDLPKGSSAKVQKIQQLVDTLNTIL